MVGWIVVHPQELSYLPNAFWPIRERSNPVTLAPLEASLALVGMGAKPFEANLALVGMGAKPFEANLACAGKDAKNKLAHPAITTAVSILFIFLPPFVNCELTPMMLTSNKNAG